MQRNQKESSNSPVIFLAGDNPRTTMALHRALAERGFHVQATPSYQELYAIWEQERQSHSEALVLLEVSGGHAVEAAVQAALQFKRHDPQQFVAYLADPVLHTSGLAGDAILPRASDHLAQSLTRLFRGES